MGYTENGRPIDVCLIAGRPVNTRTLHKACEVVRGIPVLAAQLKVSAQRLEAASISRCQDSPE